jgi:ankyrin repeat protein
MPRIAVNREQEHSAVPRKVDLKAASRKRPRATGYDTALRLAAQEGREQLVRALILAGANVQTAADGWTALLRAAEGGHEGCVRALLDADANVDANTDDGSTALMLACADNAVGCQDICFPRTSRQH